MVEFYRIVFNPKFSFLDTSWSSKGYNLSFFRKEKAIIPKFRGGLEISAHGN